MKRSVLSVVVMMCVAGSVHADQTIRSLQQTLKKQGLYYGAITGEKNAETTAGIRRYQIRNGLQVTGEVNDETSRSLNATSHSVAAASVPNPKSAATPPYTIRPDASTRVMRNAPAPSLSQSDHSFEINPSYSARFYQSVPVRMNRHMIAAAQYALMNRGYYRGPIDGNQGSQTGLAIRAFQSNAGIASTGRLDMQTLEALGATETNLAYRAPASHPYENWVPVRKFKHGKWKVKWKSYERPWTNDDVDEDRQANSGPGGNPYNED
jgi:peptidoglycan hydrolase-like protein with peptidoglycan-binding domain